MERNWYFVQIDDTWLIADTFSSIEEAFQDGLKVFGGRPYQVQVIKGDPITDETRIQCWFFDEEFGSINELIYEEFGHQLDIDSFQEVHNGHGHRPLVKWITPDGVTHYHPEYEEVLRDGD